MRKLLKHPVEQLDSTKVASAQFPRLDFGYVFKKPMNNSCVKIQVARFFAVGKTVKKSQFRLGQIGFGQVFFFMGNWPTAKSPGAQNLGPPFFYTQNHIFTRLMVLSMWFLMFIWFSLQNPILLSEIKAATGVDLDISNARRRRWVGEVHEDFILFVTISLSSFNIIKNNSLNII